MMGPNIDPFDARDAARVLTINVGSSSIRFAFFTDGTPPSRGLSGQVERIGLPGTVLKCKDPAGQSWSEAFPSSPPAEVTQALLEWFQAREDVDTIGTVAHRVVHGGPKYHEPQRVTPELLAELRRITSMDPDHLPAEIEMIEAVQERIFPKLAQGSLFRHGVSCARCHALRPSAADPAPVRSDGVAAVRISRSFVHVFARKKYGTIGLARRPREGRVDFGAPRQRREHGGGQGRPVHRYEHGVHAGSRVCP